MKSPRYCLGMAVADDFNGVWMTVQTARLNNPDFDTEAELIVVDNNPSSEEGKLVADYVAKLPMTFKKYIKIESWKGTAIRDIVFRKATAPVVVCVDSHVLLPGNSLESAVRYLEANQSFPIILSGPILYDGGGMDTHWEPEWRNGMFGTWAKDPLVNGEEAFAIPMVGLGAFASRKEHWQGFNPMFNGFGGEEFYIHEKYRRAGGQAICLPQFVWNHRFQRPKRGYTSYAWQQVRNYVLGWLELGLDIQPALKHFNELFGPAVTSEGYRKAMADLASAEAEKRAMEYLSQSGILKTTTNPVVQ